MLTLENIQSTKGFNNNSQRNEHYYSTNIATTQRGVAPLWTIDNYSVISSPIVSMSEAYNLFFTAHQNNTIYGAGSYDGTFTLQNTAVQTISHLITDQRGRLIYIQSSMVGMFDGTTWNDTWKSFGTTSVHGKPTLYEDWIVIPAGNKLGLINTVDDSFNPDAFTLPSEATIVSVDANRTGILVTANMNGKGQVILWQPEYLRAITPWLALDSYVLASTALINDFIVVTSENIHVTNGYSLKTLTSSVIDTNHANSISNVLFNNLANNGVLVFNEKLYLSVGNMLGGRMKNGIYIFDLNTKLFDYISTNKDNFSSKIIYKTKTNEIIFANPRTTSSHSRLRQQAARNATLWFEFGKSSPTTKVAQALKLHIDRYIEKVNAPDGTNITLDVDIYDFKRPLWNTAIISDTSTVSTLKVGFGNARNARVGDEIRYINTNEVSYIASITEGVPHDTWTLTTPLSTIPEFGSSIEYLPLRKIGTYSITPTNIKDVYVNIKNRIMGRKFLIRLTFTNVGSFVPDLLGGYFVYDDLGLTNTR